MAYGLGFGGGFADAGGEPEPQSEQPPVVVGGGASVLVRRQWIARPFEVPTPRPVSARARTTIRYRISARIVAVAPTVRLPQPAVDLAIRRVGVGIVVRSPVRITTKAATELVVDPKALSRFAHDMRELNELAVVLTLLD